MFQLLQSLLPKRYSLLSWKSTGRPSGLQDDICNCLVDISTCLSQHVQNCTFSLISLIADPIFFISVSHFSMYPGAEDKILQTVLYTSLSLRYIPILCPELAFSTYKTLFKASLNLFSLFIATILF